MSRFWSDTARHLSPYIPGEQPRVRGLIKLNTNEHPLEPSEKAIRAIKAVSSDSLRRYPDPTSQELCSAIAVTEGLQINQVFVGNGSDEILAHVFQALLSSSSVVNVPDITYSFYPVWAKLYGLECQTLPLNKDFSIDVDSLAALDGPILLANPNAPTGIALDLDSIEKLVFSERDRLVVVDEAYFGFGAQSATRLLDRADNLLVTRSLSKSHALAGLRVGFALGQSSLIDGLVRVKDSFNSYHIDAMAQAGAAAAILDREWLLGASEAVAGNRDWLVTELTQLGFEVCPSQANFLFVRHRSAAGQALFDGLRSRNILVRRWDKARISEHLRISIGTREQCEALIAALKALLEE